MLNVIAVIIVYTIILYLISPVVDHMFTPLDEEKDDKIIMVEVLGQIIVVAFFWYFITLYIINKLNVYLQITKYVLLDKANEVIAGVVIVGLQRHLIKKLEYLTLKHPFRFLNLYED